LSVATDADSDNYVADASVSSQCVGGIDATLRYKDSSGSYTRRLAGSITGYSDCNDADSALNVLRTLWTDADSDGYYGTVTSLACVTAAVSNASITNHTNYPDCADNDSNVHALLTGYYDADGDGRFGTYSASVCTAQVSGSSNDCNDANVNVWTTGYGVDADADGYGVSTFGCNNGAGNQTATLGQDCYDSGTNAALAHPGQTNYYAVARGDGSFDYDCNGTADYQYPYAEQPYGPPSYCYDGPTQYNRSHIYYKHDESASPTEITNITGSIPGFLREYNTPPACGVAGTTAYTAGGCSNVANGGYLAGYQWRGGGSSGYTQSCR
jgi:hypothetical protein